MFSTLWVKTINNAVEECQAAEKSILTDRAMFTITGKANKNRTILIHVYQSGVYEDVKKFSLSIFRSIESLYSEVNKSVSCYLALQPTSTKLL